MTIILIVALFFILVGIIGFIAGRQDEKNKKDLSK